MICFLLFERINREVVKDSSVIGKVIVAQQTQSKMECLAPHWKGTIRFSLGA